MYTSSSKPRRFACGSTDTPIDLAARFEPAFQHQLEVERQLGIDARPRSDCQPCPCAC
jgi:hypothetical protein